jgi:hypothetical protein
MGGEPAIAGRNTTAVRTEASGYLPLLEPRNNSPAPLIWGQFYCAAGTGPHHEGTCEGMVELRPHLNAVEPSVRPCPRAEKVGMRLDIRFHT